MLQDNIVKSEEELISILMPTYNVVKYIEEAVMSILNQTYSKFELIIVDDCSSDGTYEILCKLAQLDSRIILERNEKNSKICVTLNKAWKLAKGNYIARMDGDDISTPERLERLKKFLDVHKDIDLVGSQVISIKENGDILSYKKYLKTPQYIERGNRIEPSVSHIWLARHIVYEKLDGYRNIPYAEDYDFLLRGEKEGFRYANVDEYLYKVRIRNGNTGSTNGLQQRKVKDFVQKLNCGEKICNEEVYRQYEAAIKCTEDELKCYNRAHAHLELAIRSRKKPLKLIMNVLIGIFESKYIFNYMVDAIRMRTLLVRESINIRRKNNVICDRINGRK